MVKSTAHAVCAISGELKEKRPFLCDMNGVECDLPLDFVYKGSMIRLCGLLTRHSTMFLKHTGM